MYIFKNLRQIMIFLLRRRIGETKGAEIVLFSDDFDSC